VAEGFTNDLVFEAGVAALVALLIAWHDMPLILAAPAVLLRVGMTALYFALFFDGSWCMADDLNYFDDSARMLRDGFNPISVLFTSDGLDALYNAATGHHILYYWWNMTAMYCFGEHYYAAIFLNVLCTFVSGFLLNRIATMLGFSRNYRVGLELFFLLHWDGITWGAFVNLKDCLVQMLTVAGMYCVVRFCLLRDWWSVIGFAVILQLFYWVRFYLPVLILVSTVIWAVWQWRDPRKYLLLPIICAATYFAVPTIGNSGDAIEPRGFVYGFCVILVSPLPWQWIREEFWVLGVASGFHLLFLLPAAYGAWQLWQTSRMFRLFIIYLFVVLSFYAVVEDLRGARQRFQLSFIFAWLQFQFLWSMRPAAAPKAVPASHLGFHPSPASRRLPLVTSNSI
jgi:hypothetical protein